MAKDKIVKEKKTIEDILGEEFGGGVFQDASNICNNPPKIISVSPALDMILGGGIPEGSFVVLTGPPKASKTTSSLHFAGNCQKELGSKVYILNIEGRLKKRDLEGIKNLDLSPDKLCIIGSEEGNILTAEKYISMAEKLINSTKKSVIIVDSFSALCTESRYNANIGDRFRDDTPLLLASFCKRIANVLPINKNILIGITHRISNTSGMGHSMYSEASGVKVQYQADVKLAVTHFTPVMDKDSQVGQENHWVCTTSAIGGPGGKTTTILRYGYGLDKESEVVKLASDFGLITKGGSWFTFPDGGEGIKIQGLEKARDYLIENPDVYNSLNSQIREMFAFAKVL